MNTEQEKAELRQIEKELEKEEAVKALKQKHGITGTLSQQKQKVEEKKAELQNEEIIPDNNQEEAESV